MQLDATLRDRWQQTDDGWCFAMPAGWSQGRAVFGGLSAAAAVALSHRHLPDPWQLRTANVQFLRPSSTETIKGSFAIHRQGKGTTFAETRLSSGGDDVLVVQQVFVKQRPSEVAIEAPALTLAKTPEQASELPYVPGVTPEFTQHVAMRWVDGGFPFSGNEHARLTGYCRFRVPFGDVEGVLALLDVWPSPSLSILSKPAASSSVMWTAHILAVPDATDGWFGFEYETIAAADGLHTCVGRLFDPHGALIGWTEQLVTVFA